MAIRPFLAMTAAEIRGTETLPPKTAWMACHFSPYSTGLSNLPKALPPGSMVILDDITPIHGHDSEAIAAQLRPRLDALKCSGVLLDFQRPGYEEAELLARRLSETLPCPVGVSALYGQALSCPVFLPPVPPDVNLADYLAPWQGREIWLELALGGQAVALKADGAHFGENRFPRKGIIHADDALHCHYVIEEQQDAFIFHTWRTAEDLGALLEDAGQIKFAVGLYQELAARPKVSSFPPAGG